MTITAREPISCAACGRPGYERTFRDEKDNESWCSLPAGWWMDLVDIVIVCSEKCRTAWLNQRAERGPP